MTTLVFPASGPAFFKSLPPSVTDVQWLIGSSTGALRAACLYFGVPEHDLVDAYCAMVWRPWSTPRDLTRMLRANVRLVVRKHATTSRARLAIIVTHTRVPPFLVLLVCAVGWLFGMYNLVYALTETHVYTTPGSWTFPLQIPHHTRFFNLTPQNIEEVLYATTRIPLLSTSSHIGCDGGLVFSYCNGIPRHDADVILMSDTARPTRAILDPRPIAPSIRVRTVLCQNSIVDWFHPYYVLFPDARRAAWLR